MLVALARALLAGRVLAGASWRRGIAHIALALHTFEDTSGLGICTHCIVPMPAERTRPPGADYQGMILYLHTMQVHGHGIATRRSRSTVEAGVVLWGCAEPGGTHLEVGLLLLELLLVSSLGSHGLLQPIVGGLGAGVLPHHPRITCAQPFCLSPLRRIASAKHQRSAMLERRLCWKVGKSYTEACNNLCSH